MSAFTIMAGASNLALLGALVTISALAGPFVRERAGDCVAAGIATQLLLSLAPIFWPLS